MAVRSGAAAEQPLHSHGIPLIERDFFMPTAYAATDAVPHARLCEDYEIAFAAAKHGFSILLGLPFLRRLALESLHADPHRVVTSLRASPAAPLPAMPDRPPAMLPPGQSPLRPTSRETAEVASHHAPPTAMATAPLPRTGRVRVRYFGQIYAMQIARMEDVMTTVRTRMRDEERANCRTGMARLVADRERALNQLRTLAATGQHGIVQSGIAAHDVAERIRRERKRVRHEFGVRRKELAAQHARARRVMEKNLARYRYASENAIREFIKQHDGLYRDFCRDRKALPPGCGPRMRDALTSGYLTRCASNARLSMRALLLLTPPPNYYALLGCRPPDYREAMAGPAGTSRQKL